MKSKRETKYVTTEWEIQLAENSDDKSGSQKMSASWGYSKNQTLPPVLTGAGVTTQCYSPPEALTGDHKPGKPTGEEGMRGIAGYSNHLLKVALQRRAQP